MPQPERILAGSSSLATHGGHFAAAAAFLVVGLVAAALADARDRRRAGGAGRVADRRRDLARPVSLACAAAAVGAAAVHVFVIPEHFEESALYGAFFVGLAAVQLAWAAGVVMRPDRRLLVAGVFGNAAVVVLWAFTRFVAVPLGPGAGSREEIGALDIVATSFELVVIATGLLVLARPTTPTTPAMRAARQTLKRNSTTSPSAIT